LGTDRKLEEFFGDGVVFCTYGSIADVCLNYLTDGKIREKIAKRGFAIMKSLDQVQFLREALKGSI
jgi:hypothetical protein